MASLEVLLLYLRIFFISFMSRARGLLSLITSPTITAEHGKVEKWQQAKPVSGRAPSSWIQHQHSKLVDPSTYNDLGLCGGLPLRVHKHAHLADKGARRAQEDWKRLVGPIRNFTGCLSPRFNGIAVAIPECIPERLETVTYANEFAFLHDGKSASLFQSRTKNDCTLTLW
jgi:hypothetical protein